MDKIIAGVDEAGRGPLAGPVVAAAVILHRDKPIVGLTDSKLLTEKKREELFSLIYEHAFAVSVGQAEVIEIDEINILQASLLAMKRAIEGLPVIPDLALIDGNQSPKVQCITQTIIQGDLLEPSISAASIIAKVTRDRMMIALDRDFPQYKFAQHKGYATSEHLSLLKKHGPCLLHRRSFSPIKETTHQPVTAE